ncbi:MAG: hypothetical protein GY906_17400 [bacterium]|nr:hypothetical protein [bacterium]
MKRILRCCPVVVLVIIMVSCSGGGKLNDSEASVYLTAEVVEYAPDVDICAQAGFDVTIDSLNINSHIVGTGVVVNDQQDVTLTRWVVTPYRTDGGPTVSPVWINDINVYVPAEGQASLSDYRVFPAEYFTQVPLSYLLPENGGVDPETGNRNIRQPLNVEIFGVTNGGRNLSVEFDIAFNFTCN